MRLTENAVAADLLVESAWLAQEKIRDRLDGVHVSDITLCSRKAWLKRHGHREDYDIKSKLLFLVGSGHHAILQSISLVPTAVRAEIEVPIRYISPGVLIHGTADMLIVEADEFPGEVKTTRYSAARNPESFAHYIEQLACYCVTCQSLRGRLYVLHLAGDYRTERTPVLKCWDVEFTQEEMGRWEEEMKRRHALITGSSKPSVYEAYDWECGYCPFAEKNGGPCPGGGIRVPFFLNTHPPSRIPLAVE